MPFLFGVTNRRVRPSLRALAQKVADAAECDADIVCAEGRTWWATRGPSIGFPFDGANARAVMDALRAAGIYRDIYPEGKG